MLSGWGCRQTKPFSEISVYLNYLKRLLQVRRDFTEFCRRQTFNIYVYAVICFHVRCLGFLNVTILWHAVSECIRVSKPIHIQHRHNCTLRHMQGYSHSRWQLTTRSPVSLQRRTMYELSITNVDISYQRMNTAPLQTHCQPHSKYVQPLPCIQIWLYRKNKSVEHNWRTASRTGTPSAAETSNDVPSALDRNLTGCRLHSTVLSFRIRR